MNRGRVVHVEAVMTPATSPVSGKPAIPIGTTVEDTLRILSREVADEGVVVSPAGAPLGIVSLRQLSGAMVNAH